MTYATFLDILRGIGFTVGTIASIIAIILAWKAWRHGGKWLTPIRNLAITGNAFAKKVLPGVLEKFEEKEIAPKGTLKSWTEIVSDEFFRSRSTKRLSELGEKILWNSGIKKIIDDHYDLLVVEMEKHDPTNAIDVEEAAFYILLQYEDTEVMKPIINWLYNNPDLELSTIVFVGSYYLRDLYLAKHPEISRVNEISNQGNST